MRSRAHRQRLDLRHLFERGAKAEIVIAEQRAVVEPQAIHNARTGMRRWLGNRLGSQWQETYREMADSPAFLRIRRTPAGARSRILPCPTWSSVATAAPWSWHAASSARRTI